MVFGIGTDIIEVDRMEQHLKSNSALKNKLFTPLEQEYCESKSTVYQNYAARFAAKEAFFKALGTGYRYGMSFCEIEIFNDELGKPFIKSHGKVADFLRKESIQKLHLSISHVKTMANAFVVLEK